MVLYPGSYFLFIGGYYVPKDALILTNLWYVQILNHENVYSFLIIKSVMLHDPET